MEAASIRRVVVIGTGLMGPGIAQSFASGGREVTLVGRSPESVARGIATVEANLRAMVAEGLMTAGEAARTRARIEGTIDLEGRAAEADLVTESIVEDLAIKRDLFERLDQACPTHTLITTNTSGLPITQVSAGMSRPERAATTHYWNPPHLMPLVEIVKGERTSEETVQILRSLLAEIGKRPVVVRKDVPGQLGNRIFHAIKREAMYIVQEGIATAEEVDTAIKMGLGLRLPVYGPLEHTDLNGLEMSLAIESYLFQSLCSSTEPLPILKEKIDRGETGVKAGLGFYDWSLHSASEVKRIRDEFLMARVKELYPPRKPS